MRNNRIKIKMVSDKRADLQVPRIGYVQLSKFSPDFDHGAYRDKPWHVVTFGRNFATIQQCIDYINSVIKGWDEDEEYLIGRPICHGEMTLSFLATEASLDACPW